ncbi:hypothetical protein DR950_41290 [Kitasatospora xanthocidica]|uniref:Uncharacterized protein n=1 Tax=Kitasatospora xanthocidica TaxID=83382 RepID=A0A372ZJL0_9ACTN|nr:hypothetical protein [Kitasatospora xanthocidica]RGD55754.1 hypothetical protein DR950_41290 [Kitasatospora xanthocidica]
MTARRISRGKRLALLLAALVSALFAVLGTGAQAYAAEPLPKPAAAAEGDPTCKAHHAAEALTGRAAVRHRACGGTAVRTAFLAPVGTGVAATPATVPTGPVPEANGSRPAALARLQVFRC